MTCQAMRCYRCVVTQQQRQHLLFHNKQKRRRRNDKYISYYRFSSWLLDTIDGCSFCSWLTFSNIYYGYSGQSVCLSFSGSFFCHVLNVFELLFACPTLKDNFNIVNQMPQCRQQFSSGKLRSSSGRRILCFIRACDLGYRN